MWPRILWRRTIVWLSIVTVNIANARLGYRWCHPPRARMSFDAISLLIIIYDFQFQLPARYCPREGLTDQEIDVTLRDISFHDDLRRSSQGMRGRALGKAARMEAGQTKRWLQICSVCSQFLPTMPGASQPELKKVRPSPHSRVFCNQYSRCVHSSRAVYGQAVVHPSPRRSQSERHPPRVRHLPQHRPRRSHRGDKPRAEEPNRPGGQCALHRRFCSLVACFLACSC
jgi:hypothetical protein